MTGRLEMGMLTRVSTGSCWVAASVAAPLALGEGGSGCGGWGVVAWVLVRVWVRTGSLLLRSYFMRFLGLCGVVLVMFLLLLVVVVLLRAVLLFGFRFWFWVGFWVGVRFEVEEDLVLEVRGHRCWVGGFPGVLPGCLGCLCGGRRASGSLACSCSFGLILGAAPLSLFRELDFNSCGLQALGVPVEAAPLGVLAALVGATSAGGGGGRPFFSRQLTLRCAVGCSSSTRGGGVRTLVLHTGYPYHSKLQG